jgi:hypothetical protein
MHLKNILYLALSFVMTAVVAACGNSDSAVQYPVNASVTTASYKVEYIPVTTATAGKSVFKIKLSNKTTGAAVTGKTITLQPTMTMLAGANHATPFEAITDNGDGTYSGTIYYVMASVAADGTPMGTWKLDFTVDGETASFTPTVEMAMAAKTTALIKLKGIDDKIGSMGSMVGRTYQLFNDGISGSTVKLFISAADDSMMMKFPAVSVGTNLTGMAVAAMSVEVSTDKTAWSALTDNGNGHWSKTGGPVLSSGAHLYIRLTVNGEQKTTDGSAAGAANAYGDVTIGM